MAFYVKKTVRPIEAKELTQHNRDGIMEWCNGKKGLDGTILLKTPESDNETQMVVSGDFILKGYTDELGWHFWPVKPSYFNENYEKVRD